MEILRSENFILREPVISDAQSIARHMGEKDVLLGTGLEKSLDEKETAEWVEKVRISNAQGNGLRVVIDVGGEAVGGITFKNFNDSKAEIGYWLARQFWGKGIMSEAVKIFVGYGFERLGLKEIYAYAFLSNPASIRVLEKAGFVQEKVLQNENEKVKYYIFSENM